MFKCSHDWKSKLTSFLILFVPTGVMIGFIIWAVYESTANNQTSIIELDDTRCLIKTSLSRFTTWLGQDSTNGTDVLSVSGGSKLIAIVAKAKGDDCEDIYSD